MEAEILWENFDHRTEIEVKLIKLSEGRYELFVSDPYTSSSAELDRKHLKDLFVEVGTELNYWGPVHPIPAPELRPLNNEIQET